MHVHHVDTEQYLTSICQLISEGHQVTIPVRGNSMSPFLTDGRDRVLLTPVPERISRGDIVLFRRKSGQYILHRIISVKQDGRGGACYYMRGDAQQTEEGAILRCQICALAGPVMRKGVWLTLHDPQVLFFRHIWWRRWFPRSFFILMWRKIRQYWNT